MLQRAEEGLRFLRLNDFEYFFLIDIEVLILLARCLVLIQ
jgi:hypothetical protein